MWNSYSAFLEAALSISMIPISFYSHNEFENLFTGNSENKSGVNDIRE